MFRYYYMIRFKIANITSASLFWCYQHYPISTISISIQFLCCFLNSLITFASDVVFSLLLACGILKDAVSLLNISLKMQPVAPTYVLVLLSITSHLYTILEMRHLPSCSCKVNFLQCFDYLIILLHSPLSIFALLELIIVFTKSFTFLICFISALYPDLINTSG